jgi:hypothetical protein
MKGGLSRKDSLQRWMLISRGVADCRKASHAIRSISYLRKVSTRVSTGSERLVSGEAAGLGALLQTFAIATSKSEIAGAAEGLEPTTP